MKDELRKQLKIARAAFSGAERENADRAIFDFFTSAFGGYESFFIYNSLPEEADTKLIIRALLNSGKRVYLPRVEGGNICAAPYGETKKGAFGVLEPVGQAFCGDIQITVVPLLGINKRGFRIGYGGGYYDRYLSGARTKKIGIGYCFQMTEFKEDEWDVPLDYFLCERGIYGV